MPSRSRWSGCGIVWRSALGCLVFLAACKGQVDDANMGGGDLCGARAPLRRLTRFEYNNTVRDLLGDTTAPGNLLPAEELGNGFGNDADRLSVSSLLAEEYDNVAQAVAERATATPALLALLAPCASTVTASTEEACARAFIESFVPRVYRRPLEAGEADDLLALYKAIRVENTFTVGVASVMEAVLQSPDFLYRVEWGVPDRAHPEWRRPSGYEMATRLSYLYWATSPDDELWTAAGAGNLLTADGVRAQASRLLDDPRSRPVVSFFFDSLLPINGLSDLARDSALYPTFTPTIGSLMRQETQSLLEHVIFDQNGDWPSALTAPFTFVNEQLAAFYGISGVTGSDFQQVPLDTSRRMGFLTLGGAMVGSTPSNNTNPVIRGNFVQAKLLCNGLSLPTGDILAKVVPPDPYSAPTARERYSIHSQMEPCHTCHKQMDPIGFALENFNAVGLWRDTENGETIDATGSVPGVDDAPVNGPVALVQKIAAASQAQACFADHWIEFGYGRTLGAGDLCTRMTVEEAFQKSGYNVRQLLLSLAQTNAFLYLPVQ